MQRRLQAHHSLGATWKADLAISALGVRFAASPPTPVASGAVEPTCPQDEQAELPRTDDGSVDSDDASDAYSTVVDEDEPLAELLDDLEPTAEDQDGDADAAAEGDAPLGQPQEEEPLTHGREAEELGDAVRVTVRATHRRSAAFLNG